MEVPLYTFSIVTTVLVVHSCMSYPCGVTILKVHVSLCLILILFCNFPLSRLPTVLLVRFLVFIVAKVSAILM